MVVLGTVILQSLSAKFIAKYLNVRASRGNGVLFLGANEIAIFIAEYLNSQKIPVLLTDTSKSNLKKAKEKGLSIREGSLLDEDTLLSVDLIQYDKLFALTSNPDINTLGCKIIKKPDKRNRDVQNPFRLRN